VSKRWKFPHVEGIVVDEKTGRWSIAAFHNDLLAVEDRVPETWHQAEPTSDNNRADDWKRWAEYLGTEVAPRTLLETAQLHAERRLRDLGAGQPRRLRRVDTTLFYVPMRAPCDVIPLLAKPEHWEQGRSAYELAHAWFRDGKLPTTVKTLWDKCPEYRNAQVVWGGFEHTTRLDEFPSPSQTDLLVLLRLTNGKADRGRAIVAVEGKVDEPFDKLVSARRSEAGDRSNWPERLKRLCNALNLKTSAAEALRYQLIHRTVAALIEAKRHAAKHAMMLVHSFTENNPKFEMAKGDGFGEFEKFALAVGFKKIGRNQITEARDMRGIRLRLAWVVDRPDGR
jgi:hypothetical protein